MSVPRRASRVAAQKAENTFGDIIKQEEETQLELKRVAQSSTQVPSLIFSARFDSEKGKAVLEYLADAHPEYARPVQPFHTLKFKSEAAREKFRLVLDTQAHKESARKRETAAAAAAEETRVAHSFPRHPFPTPFESQSPASNDFTDNVHFTSNWSNAHLPASGTNESEDVVFSQHQIMPTTQSSFTAVAGPVPKIHRPTEVLIHRPAETLIVLPRFSPYTLFQSISLSDAIKQAALSQLSLSSRSYANDATPPLKPMAFPSKNKTSRSRIWELPESAFEKPRGITGLEPQAKKIKRHHVPALDASRKLDIDFGSNEETLDEDAQFPRSQHSSLVVVAPKQPTFFNWTASIPPPAYGKDLTVTFPHSDQDDSKLPLVDSMYFPSRPLPEHESYRVGPRLNQRLMKFQECPNGWNGERPTPYNSDYSDPRYWAAASPKDQLSVWKALQPTMSDYWRHTGEALTLDDTRNLCDGYMAAYGWIHLKFQQWCFAVKGHNHQWTSGGKVTHKLFKLERWYGLLEDYYYAPNWPGPRRYKDGRIIQNPDCFACGECIRLNVFCHGHREDAQARCTPCVINQRQCSKKLF